MGAYLEEFGQNLLRTAGIRCQMDMPPQFPARVITAEVRHNLFLAFQEALNNAIKHSGASEVRIALVVESTDFILAIEDNGKGFVWNSDWPDAAESSPARAPATGWRTCASGWPKSAGSVKLRAWWKRNQGDIHGRLERISRMKSPEPATGHPSPEFNRRVL